ncbi:MAG: RdgB/HAM1 family non-canonical purine NTP pyrophosphatase [Cytophagia bacterium]|nr:RdgB/HAM1 family non-canonical purine NTP pyrophosphatase [Cytophagia bacterium]
MELYLATQNKHKIEELSALLGTQFLIKSISELGVIEDIPETGKTLAENSMQKAQFIADRFGVTCLSDDSGLEVDCLGGLPGVYSARFAGEPKNDVANSTKLLVDMSRQADRSARFVTVLTFHQDGQFHQFEGEIKGEIVLSPRGNHGFGYDPLFQPENESRTFAEMTLSEKNVIAHRARALHKFKMFADESLKFVDE